MKSISAIPEATLLYHDTLSNGLTFIIDTMKSDIDNIPFSKIKKAKRIYFVGVGSSEPAARLGALIFSNYLGLPSAFCLPADILTNNTLSSDDVVLLVSQGWNRGEAVLITEKTQKSHASLIVITGRPDRISNYQSKNTYPLQIYPAKEKLFSRPVSPITSFLKILQITTKIEDKVFPIIKYCELAKCSLEKDNSEIVLGSDFEYVIIGSGMTFPVAKHLALALREGAGVNANAFDIESYGHGWYVSDIMISLKRKNTIFVPIIFKKDQACLTAWNRIRPLLDKTGMAVLPQSLDLDSVDGAIFTMIKTAKLIGKLISETNFDMNHPVGMEENKSFHEITI